MDSDQKGLVGRRVGFYRLSPDSETPELVAAGTVRHLWVDAEGDLGALLEEEGASAGLLATHWLNSRDEEAWVLQADADPFVDPAPAAHREHHVERVRKRRQEEANRAEEAAAREAVHQERTDAIKREEQLVLSFLTAYSQSLDAQQIHRRSRRARPDRERVWEELAAEWRDQGRAPPSRDEYFSG